MASIGCLLETAGIIKDTGTPDIATFGLSAIISGVISRVGTAIKMSRELHN
jgi:hypothetical protein